MNKRMLKELAEKYPDYVLQPYGSMMGRIGFEGVYSFADAFGGASLYIPHPRTLFTECVAQQVKEEYNGHNLRELCRKYDYCDKTIKAMLAR